MAVEAPRRAPNERVSLIPYGLNEQHPNHYKDILKVVWDNRDRLPYALRIPIPAECPITTRLWKLSSLAEPPRKQRPDISMYETGGCNDGKRINP
jgi:hypothetical protein